MAQRIATGTQVKITKATRDYRQYVGSVAAISRFDANDHNLPYQVRCRGQTFWVQEVAPLTEAEKTSQGLFELITAIMRGTEICWVLYDHLKPQQGVIIKMNPHELSLLGGRWPVYSYLAD